MSKLVSIRLDEEVIDLINTYEGKTFTERFLCMVYFKDKEYEGLIDNYNRQKRLLVELQNRYRKLSDSFFRLERLASAAQKLVYEYSDIQ